MKIKLLMPRMSLRPVDSEMKRLMSPSLSLLTLGALTPPEHDIVMEDENVRPLTIADRPDLVGITVNVDTSGRAYELADMYRSRGIRVVLGGIHASACPGEAAAHADAICVGPAEELWPRVVADAANGGLQPRYEGEHALDGALIPSPRWELANVADYLYTNIVCASRGCPHRCEFCYNSCAYIRHGHRTRPVADVLKEVQRLDTRHVMFIDDNLIGNLRWARELTAALAGLGIKWNGAVSADIGRHPDLMDAMAGSGCQSLFIGFESLNPASLLESRKTQNRVEHYEATVEALHARGIMINASLVFGFDGDTPAVFSETLDWLVAHRLESMTAHILTPYPGTVLYRRLDREGRIIDREPAHYNTSHVVFQPMGMTAEELREGFLWMYRRFYALPNIVRRLPRARRQWLPFLLFNFGYRKFGRLTSLLGKAGGMARIGRLARRLAYGID